MQQTLARQQHAAPAPPAPPLPGFAEFGVSRDVVQALAMRGFDATFPIQSLVLADALAGRDVLARSRTGSGKTLAFAVPIVERLTADGRSPTALILVPTRELASQVTEEFRAIADVHHLQVASVYGGVGIGAQAKKARRADILIATPGRLLDLVARRLLRLDRVRICVLDEADRMLDMGFLPDVTRILELLRPERQTMLFSATLDGEVGRLAARFTSDPVSHAVRGRAAGDRRGAASVHLGGAAEQDVGARARARGRPRPHADLRPHAARRRPPGEEPEGPGIPRRCAPRRDVAAATRTGARPLRLGGERRARGDRRGGARAGSRRHHPRDQLRRAGRREGLRASRGPHRESGPRRRGHHVRHAGAAARRQPDRRQARAPRGVRAGRDAGGAAGAGRQREGSANGSRNGSRNGNGRGRRPRSRARR